VKRFLAALALLCGCATSQQSLECVGHACDTDVTPEVRMKSCNRDEECPAGLRCLQHACVKEEGPTGTVVQPGTNPWAPPRSPN
jgi:hypothetical protein